MQETYTSETLLCTSHTHKPLVENHFNCFYQSVVTWDFLPRGWEMSPGPETQINARRFLWHTYIACVMDLDCLGITSEAKECACMICVQCCDLKPTGTGLIASVGSESSCVHCFEKQGALQMKNAFTFHCTKNPAVHLSSIQTHLPLLFLSFPPSWHSSRSTFGWKALSLISFQPLFLIKKTRGFFILSKSFLVGCFSKLLLRKGNSSSFVSRFSLSIQSLSC